MPATGKVQASEIRYRRLFESARDGILILDAVTKKITDVNPFMIEFLEYSREEFLGKELWEIGLLKDEAASIAAFKELQVNYYIRYEDLPLKTKGGERREVEFVSNVYLEHDRQVIQCNIRDITERKAAENEMRLMKCAIDSIVEGVLICDAQQPDHPTIYANAAFKKLTGYGLDEIKGRNCRFMQGAETNRRTVDEIRKTLKKEKTFHGEIINYRKNGQSYWNELKISPIFDDSGRLTNFVGIQRDVSKRKNSEESLRLAEAKYRNIVESLPAIVYLSDLRPPYAPIYVSSNIEKFGYTAEECYASPDIWVSLLHRDDRQRVLRAIEAAMTQNLETELEYRIVARDGSVHWWQDKGRFILDDEGKRAGWQGIILDVTKTKELEQHLRQAQKLESVGLLAGGIAHDFNNMLAVIIGYSDLVIRRLEEDDPSRPNIEEIRKAGQRSANLTHQLLAFSRQQLLQPVVLDLNEIIVDTIKMLQRLISEDIVLTATLSPHAGRIFVDPGQFSQILMNLVVNARDAMPAGGRLTIETASVKFDQVDASQHVGLLPGAYVRLIVSDTGSGMSSETKEHLFEPFFTTKDVGQGTGLGLATVYGIVKQSGGNIEVYSKEGIGTTFKIYLPSVSTQISLPKIIDDSFEMSMGTETILLVEDEEMVRHLSKKILETCGYTVIEARNGVEALEICAAKDCQFDLLITDVIMPQMGGPELAGKLLTESPNLRVLFTSGYTDDAIVRHGLSQANTNFIQKPFKPGDLANKIREILNYVEQQ